MKCPEIFSFISIGGQNLFSFALKFIRKNLHVLLMIINVIKKILSEKLAASLHYYFLEIDYLNDDIDEVEELTEVELECPGLVLTPHARSKQ